MQTKLRRFDFMNQWVLCNREVNRLFFYCPERKKVLARSDVPAYLPASGDKYASTAADFVYEITEVANRRSEEVGMRNGGHFMLVNTLYLDLSQFPHYVIEPKTVYEHAGVIGRVVGLTLTYTVVRGAEIGSGVTRFFYYRDDITEIETAEAASLDALCDLYNRKVADHSSRHLSRSMAQRMLANRADFIALLSSR